MDRESAITHLQIIHTWAEFARERDLQFFTAKHLESIAQWADDAITLLKEQGETINELQNAYGYLQKQFFEAQDKLLKEQEAVKPITKSRNGEYPRIFHRCGNCNEILYKYYKFCPTCGRSVKWE